ncbi:MAG: BNR-4 repeat-containing protein [Verrucomicrobia bacterium]|nr:BNR-4 repeat-containing protein [Verrucomicrobiota bacterium]
MKRTVLLLCSLLALSTPAFAQPKATTTEKPEPLTGQTTDGYRGIWFTLGQKLPYGDKYSGGLGTYTANHVPMAVYAPKVNKTFFTYGGTVEGKRHLLIMAGYYDHKKNEVPRPTIVHDKVTVNDPHDNGSIAIDEKGHVWIFVSGRGRTRPGFKYRSVKPYDVSEFQFISEEEMTYPQPWPIKGEGFLHLFTKYTAGRELYWETSKDGVTWSEDQKLAGLRGHYQTSGAHGKKVATFFNRHPGGSVDKRTDLYYLQTTDMGKTWTTADGTPVEVPLTNDSNPALVFSYSSQGQMMYGMDLNFDKRGNPILLYIVSGDFKPGPDAGPREWTVAHWNGKQWNTNIVTRSEHNYDVGSIYVKGNEWTVYGPSERGPQRWGTGGEVAIWTSRDEGKTWKKKAQVTQDSEFNHTYVRRPVQAKDPFFAYWADGDADKVSVSRLYFGDSKGRYWQLPYDMKGEFAKPIALSGKK